MHKLNIFNDWRFTLENVCTQLEQCQQLNEFLNNTTIADDPDIYAKLRFGQTNVNIVFDEQETARIANMVRDHAERMIVAALDNVQKTALEMQEYTRELFGND